MSRQKLVVVQELSRPVAEVFARLADHEQLGEILGVRIRRVRDGRGDVNGVGSVRRVGRGPLVLEETVVGMEPNRSIDYEITRGGHPIRNHHGRIDFSQTADGTRVRWTIGFDSPLPLVGPLVRTTLERIITRGLKRRV